MNRKKLLAVSILLMVIFVWVGPSGAKEIHVLSQFPLSGPLGAFTEMGWGYIDAWNWFNNEVGGVGGQKVIFHLEDMRYDPTVEVATFNKYAAEYSKDEFLMASGYITGALKPLIKKVNEEEKIPWADGSYSSEIFGKQGGPSKYPYYYSMGATYGDQIKALLKWVVDNHKGGGKPKVAFVNSPTGFGRDGLAEGLAYAKEKGMDIVAEIEYPYSATDASNELMTIRRSKAQYVVYHGFTGTQSATAIFFKTAKKMTPKVQYLGTAYMGGAIPFLVIGDAFNGVIYAGCTPAFDAIPRSQTPMDNAMVKMMHEFAQKHRPEEYKKGIKGGIRDITLYYIGAMHAFTIQQALVEAHKAGDLSRAGIKKALDNMVWDFHGMFDGKKFSYASHTVPMVRLYQAQVKMVDMGGKKVPTGKWTPVTEWINTDEIKW